MNSWEEEINKMVFAYVEDRDNLKTFIHSLLKQQREICADTFMKPDFANSDSKNYAHQLNLSTWNEIRNAPEPSGVKE